MLSAYDKAYSVPLTEQRVSTEIKVNKKQTVKFFFIKMILIKLILGKIVEEDKNESERNIICRHYTGWHNSNNMNIQ